MIKSREEVANIVLHCWPCHIEKLVPSVEFKEVIGYLEETDEGMAILTVTWQCSNGWNDDIRPMLNVPKLAEC